MKLDLRQMVFYFLLFFLLGMLSIPINALALWMVSNPNGGSMFLFWLLILLPPILYYILFLWVIKSFKENFSSWKTIYGVPVLVFTAMITAVPHYMFQLVF